METGTYFLILEQRGKMFIEAWKALDSACAAPERGMKSKDKNIRDTSRRKRAELGQVLFWFHTGAKPDGISPGNWRALEILAQDFVERGELPKSAFDNFI